MLLAIVIVIVMAMLWLTKPSAKAYEPQSITRPLRDEFVCPGIQDGGLDDKTLQCPKETPLGARHETAARQLVAQEVVLPT
ncbi:hypothetical protein [Comamonas guangdongensis]|uniref:Uncharacterized protein n=1 Tax=Comamonas guangdongensis TaxID=510515 RepID=A0ABV3ZW31_9BURK